MFFRTVMQSERPHVTTQHLSEASKCNPETTRSTTQKASRIFCTPVHPHDAIDATTRLRLDGSRIGSGSARIVARSFIDLGCRHLPCDVSHLLGDVVPASPSLEPLELRIDVDGGPSVEPRRTELGVGRAVA